MGVKTGVMINAQGADGVYEPHDIGELTEDQLDQAIAVMERQGLSGWPYVRRMARWVRTSAATTDDLLQALEARYGPVPVSSPTGGGPGRTPAPPGRTGA
jgi:hypothetical protein